MTEQKGEERDADRALIALPAGRDMPGGYVQFDVSSIGDAVALADRFKAAGRYRYFRGQRDAQWKVRSSFARVDEADRQAEIDKFAAFYGWIHDSPELVPYLGDDDGVIATAQHHGIAATNFIDFSSEPSVAGWFATDGAVPGDEGAIFMIDPDEVTDIFDAMTRSGVVLRFLHPDVANLWRLQAQHGLFLEAQTDIDAIWPLDRIVFPQTNAAPIVDRRLIYPDRRSHLEQMIDQHLTLKKREEAMREILHGPGGPRFFHIEIGAAPDLTPPGIEVRGLPDELAVAPDERWEAMDIDTPPPVMSIDDLEARGEALARIVRARRASVDLAVIDPDPPRENGTVQALVDKLWAGMRPLPYDAGQLARAMSALAGFSRVFGDFPLSSGVSPERAAPQLLDDPIEIEMGIAGGGSTRACVTAARLWLALTPAAQVLLNLAEQPSGGRLLRALSPYYGNTLRLFDQNVLVDLFADEIVPWQVATRRNPIAFWPTHIVTLGRP